MSDDLVERLRDWPYQGETMAEQAADRIEELELAVRYEADLAQMALDARKELEAKLAKALEALEYYSVEAFCLGADNSLVARTTLAELSKERSDEKGQDDE